MTFGVILTLSALAFASNFPHWGSWFICFKSSLRGRLPFRSKLRQWAFLASHVLIAPLRGLANLVDEIFFFGYKKVDIQPVFIVGEPRCGSTLLHRTMAKSDHHLAIRHYEWRYPYVCIQKLFKILRAEHVFGKINYWPSGAVGSKAQKMHPNRLSDWEEDGIFFEENLCHHFFLFLRFPYVEVLRGAGDYSSLNPKFKAKFIREHKKSIQKIAAAKQRKTVSYLSKEVVSHSMIPDLLKEYPTARFIIVVRKSEDFMTSLMPLVRVSTSTKNAGYDPILDDQWSDLIVEKISKDCQDLCRLSRDVMPKQSQFILRSEQLFANISETVMDIYDWLELPISQDYCRELSSVSEKQLRRKKGYSNHSFQTRPDDFGDYDKFVASIPLKGFD